MVIEVVAWPKAKKSHAVNQDAPTYTLCGVWIPFHADRNSSTEDAFPTCIRCKIAVMNA